VLTPETQRSFRAYPFIVGLFLCLAFALHVGRSPIGNNFTQVIVPGLLFLNSLHWLTLPQKLLWRAAAAGVSFAVFLALYFAFLRSARQDFADFATFLFLLAVVQNAALYLLTRDNSVRLIAAAANVTTVFVVILGVFLSVHDLVIPRLSGERILVSPIGALLLCVMAADDKWRSETQVMLMLVMAQIGIGFFDVGEANGIRWMLVSCGILAFAALGIVLYWAKERNERLSDDA
jgi:hypothetical protein